MKKVIALLVVSMIITFALQSCGSGEKKDANSAQAQSTDTQTESTDQALPELNQEDLASGEATYNKYCHVCHKEGIAGAPKLGNKELWGPRAAKGMETLIKHVTEGYTGETGIMPLKGTCMECNEEDFRKAITFLLSKADLRAN